MIFPAVPTFLFPVRFWLKTIELPCPCHVPPKEGKVQEMFKLPQIVYNGL
jgi:hypothetical protein